MSCDPQATALVLGSVGTLVVVVSTAAVKVIGALREHTVAMREHTALLSHLSASNVTGTAGGGGGVEPIVGRPKR